MEPLQLKEESLIELEPEGTGEIITYEDQDLSNPRVLERPSYKLRRSPVIVTLADPNVTHVDIQKLIECGANGIWFKNIQSTTGDKIRLIGKVDKAVQKLAVKHGLIDWPVVTCIELKTCIVNTGLIEGDEEYINIKEGSAVVLTCDTSQYNKCNKNCIFVDNPFIAIETKIGTTITIAHDEIILTCKKILGEKSIKCVVVKGGKLKSLCLVCARGTKRTRPFITKKDLQIVKFALEQQIDVIVINYARQVESIKKVKQFIGKRVKRPIILTGLCTGEGLKNIDELIRESDGIVFSREFLAYELQASDLYRMMQIQKWASAKCQQAGKPFYLSGGIFEEGLLSGNIIENEISDFTNALLEGATGFILKECSDVDMTLQVIKEMNEISCNVEPFTNNRSGFWRILSEIKMPINAAEASAMSCAMAANQSNARVIIIPTVTGRTAKTLMWLRPSCIVITVSTKVGSTRLLQCYRCIVPLLYKAQPNSRWKNNQEARVEFALEYAVKRGWLLFGDIYVTLQRGADDSSYCDTVRLWVVTLTNKPIVECSEDGQEKDILKKQLIV